VGAKLDWSIGAKLGGGMRARGELDEKLGWEQG